MSLTQDTTNDRIYHVWDGMQGIYFKMLGVVRILFWFSWVRDLNPGTLSCSKVVPHSTTVLLMFNVYTVLHIFYYRAVQKSGEMVVRKLDPSQFIRLASETAPKINVNPNVSKILCGLWFSSILSGSWRFGRFSIRILKRKKRSDPIPGWTSRFKIPL